MKKYKIQNRSPKISHACVPLNPWLPTWELQKHTEKVSPPVYVFSQDLKIIFYDSANEILCFFRTVQRSLNTSAGKL
jgi:hypothetical protein